MPSETHATTIFIKLIMGSNMVHEERCTFGTQGHLLICHTFIERKTIKHFILLSVLCTHTPTPLRVIMDRVCNVKFLNIAWTPFKLCASKSLNHVIQRGNRGNLILITLCAQKDVVYLFLVNIFQFILMLQCHLMEVSIHTAYVKYREWQTHGFIKNLSCI